MAIYRRLILSPLSHRMIGVFHIPGQGLPALQSPEPTLESGFSMTSVSLLVLTSIVCSMAIGCVQEKPRQDLGPAAETTRVMNNSPRTDEERKAWAAEYGYHYEPITREDRKIHDSLPFGRTKQSYLYRVPTRRSCKAILSGDSVILRYSVLIGEKEIRLEHYYGREALDSGFMAVEYNGSSRLWLDNRLVSRYSESDPNILDLGKTNPEALVLDRGSSRTIVIYGGYLWCNGRACSSRSAIAVQDGPSGLKYIQFDTNICSEDYLWELVSSRASDGRLAIPVGRDNCGLEQPRAIAHWVNVDDVLNSMP